MLKCNIKDVEAWDEMLYSFNPRPNRHSIPWHRIKSENSKLSTLSLSLSHTHTHTHHDPVHIPVGRRRVCWSAAVQFLLNFARISVEPIAFCAVFNKEIAEDAELV